MAEPDTTSTPPDERRLALRVPVRRIVRAAVGLRAFEATLMDLSITGCRLRCQEPITAHGSVWIVLPAGFGGRLPLPVRGEVARAESVRGEPTGVCDVALRFRELSPRAHERLCSAVSERFSPPREPVGAERRLSLRHWFGRRVIARGAGAPRVLLGRDLSTGGMRVENAVGLRPGEELQLALHSQSGDVPLVLRASVLRSDPSGAAALEFSDLSSSQRVALDKLLSRLGGGGDPVVSELLEPAPRLEGEGPLPR
jgi:c-di-GMP-binding flagellar brake protein YcgR